MTRARTRTKKRCRSTIDDDEDFALDTVEEAASDDTFSLDTIEDEDDDLSLDGLEDLGDVEALSQETGDEDGPGEDAFELDTIDIEPEPEPEPEPELDEVAQIFAAEATEKLGDVNAYLTSRGSMTPEVVAALHTLKGSAGMADVPGVASVAGPLESLANQYLGGGRVADESLFELLGEGAVIITRILGDLSNLRGGVPGPGSADRTNFRVARRSR